MKYFKLDLMTVLFVVVVIGVVVTMSTQASDRTTVGTEVLQASTQSATTISIARH
jgi:hypothetical protein